MLFIFNESYYMPCPRRTEADRDLNCHSDRWNEPQQQCCKHEHESRKFTSKAYSKIFVIKTPYHTFILVLRQPIITVSNVQPECCAVVCLTTPCQL
jgi:hypothetical protein